MKIGSKKHTAHKGKIILKAALLLAAMCVFAYLYSIIRMGNVESMLMMKVKHVLVSMTHVNVVFASFILLLTGLPILR